MKHIYTHVSNHQVLQRDPITDTALVRLENGEHASFRVGGPYSAQGCQVWVGDVWVMAGQSNMRGHGNLAMVDPALAKVHLFASNESWTFQHDPLHQLIQSPRAIHHEKPDPTVKNPSLLTVRGASLGPAFAESYQQILGVHVGLVASAQGNVSMADWSPAEPDNENHTLYGAMLARVRKVGPIAGVLWYQGESDTTDPALTAAYGARMRVLIEAMRRDIRSDLPIVFAQIARTVDANANVHAWNTVREEQRKLDGLDTYIAGVSTIDSDLDDRIHLSTRSLNTVGRRMALVAKTLLCGASHACITSPHVDTVHFESKALTPTYTQHMLQVTFRHVEAWQQVDRVFGFSLRGPTDQDPIAIDQDIPIIYNTRIDPQTPDTIILYLTRDLLTLPAPAAVSLWYGYGADPTCNLVTTQGLALFAFGPKQIGL